MNPPAHTAGHLSMPPPASPASQASRRQPPGDRFPGDHHPWQVRTGNVLTCGDAGATSAFLRLTYISHLTADVAPGQVLPGVAARNSLVPGAIVPRGHARVTGMFGGLPVVAPGVVPVGGWRPAAGGQPAQSADVYAGLAAVTRRGREKLAVPGHHQQQERA